MGKLPDTTKHELIVNLLKENPQGLYLTEMARKLKMNPSSVYYHVTVHLIPKNLIKKERTFGTDKKSSIVIYKISKEGKK